MQLVPLLHRSIIVPIVALLDEMGAPAGSILNKCRLPVSGYDDPKGFVSLNGSFLLCQESADSQMLPDFGFRITERVTLPHAGRWGPKVAEALTLANAIDVMDRHIRADMPYVYVGIEQRQDGVWFWRDHIPDRRRIPGQQ